MTEDITKPDQSLDSDSPGFDSAPGNQSAEALNGTNPIYDESPSDLKTKKNVSKLTVVVDPRGDHVLRNSVVIMHRDLLKGGPQIA